MSSEKPLRYQKISEAEMRGAIAFLSALVAQTSPKKRKKKKRFNVQQKLPF